MQVGKLVGKPGADISASQSKQEQYAGPDSVAPPRVLHGLPLLIPRKSGAINRTALKIAAQKEMQITTRDNNKGNNNRNNNNRDDEMWAQNASKTIPIKR